MIDRLKLIMQAKNLTPAEFADIIDVQRSGISHLLSGRNNPSLGFVEKVLLRFPEINPDWLILGKGAMHRSDIVKELTPRELSASGPNTKAMNLFDSQPLEEEKLAEEYTESFDIIESDDLFTNNSNDSIVEKTKEEKVEEEKIEKVEEKKSVMSDQKNENIELHQSDDKKIERIIFFYSDRSFKEFKPE